MVLNWFFFFLPADLQPLLGLVWLAATFLLGWCFLNIFTCLFSMNLFKFLTSCCIFLTALVIFILNFAFNLMMLECGMDPLEIVNILQGNTCPTSS